VFRVSSRRRVEQLLDHLLHFLRPVLVILFGVLGERDVGASETGEMGSCAKGDRSALIGWKVQFRISFK